MTILSEAKMAAHARLMTKRVQKKLAKHAAGNIAYGFEKPPGKNTYEIFLDFGGGSPRLWFPPQVARLIGTQILAKRGAENSAPHQTVGIVFHTLADRIEGKGGLPPIEE